MPWRGPEYEGEFPSLGWEIVDHIEAHLKVPAGPMYGEPMVLTPDQVSFFVRLYRVDEKTGRPVYRRGCRRGAKGKGKSPEGGMFVIEEFVGPVQFDGWDANGDPVGRPRHYPWVQIIALAEDQDHNLYGPMREMLLESDFLDDERIDPGKTKIQFRDRPGLIEPVTSADGSKEGQPITAAALEETHLWLPSQGGHKRARVLRRNVGKTNGRTVEFTNAPALGEDSVAERTMAAAEKGQKGLLYSSTEAPLVEDPKNPRNKRAVIAALKAAYDDGAGKPVPWVDLERQYEEITDEDVTEVDAYRFYFNIARKAENRAFDPKAFDALAAPRQVGADEPVVLMFDGARTRDCAVLTAWTLDDRPHHFHVASWERPADPAADYEHPRGEIRAAVREFLAGHDCVVFAYDSSFHELNSLYDEWRDDHGDLDAAHGTGLMVAYPTASGQRMEKAVKRVLEDLRESAFTHDGHDLVTRHVHNAVLTKNRGGWLMLAKEKDSLKIDAAVTLTFGYDLISEARVVAAERSKEPEIMFAYTEL